MKKTLVKIIAILSVLVGVGLMAFPLVGNLLFEKQQEAIVEYYETQVSEYPQDELKKYWDEAYVYNNELAVS